MGGQVRGSPDRDVRGLTSGGGGGGGNVFVTNTNTDPIPVSVTNEITLDAATLAALETITVNQGTSPWVVSGTVSVNEPVTVDGTVDVGNFPSSFEISNDVGNPIPISGTVSVNEPVTVDGTVALDATTLAALETITANQGTSPWVVSGTVSVNEPVTVDATDLDIRDLAFATDSVDVSGSEVSLDAATLTALETITVNQGTSPWVVSGTVSVNEPVTVDATDLDIRDLAFATDSVDVSGSEVSLDSATLTALETITVNQGTSPWVVSGTVSVNEPVSVDGTVTVNQGTSPWVVDGSGVTQPISAVSLPLPTGAATAANQQTDALTDTQLRATPVPVSGTVSVNEPVTVDGTVELGATSLAALETVTVNQGTSPWVVGDGGASLTVDGPLTDAELRATPVPVSGTVTVNEPVSVDDNGGSLTVDAVNLDIRDLAFATDSVDVTGSTVAISGTVPVSLTEPISVDDNGGSLTVDGTVGISVSTGTLNNGAETSVSSSAVSVLSSNANRKAAIIQNVGSANVRVGITGVTATTGVRLKPDGRLTLGQPNVFTGAVFAIREGSTDSTVLAQEVT